jgi:pyruvate kinase
VPVLQRKIVAAARSAGRPVVIATEMLDSMRTRPRPTRAEASDVANAIFNRADAVMLSGETAVGDYPVEAVATMARIAITAEEAWPPPRPPRGTSGDDVQAAVSAVASELAEDLHVAAIVTLSQSGATALAVSRYRPDAPIIAATPNTHVARRLSVAWGVATIVLPFADQTGTLLDDVAAAVRDAGFATSGQRIAITAGLWSRTPGGTDFVHVRTV